MNSGSKFKNTYRSHFADTYATKQPPWRNAKEIIERLVKDMTARFGRRFWTFQPVPDASLLRWLAARDEGRQGGQESPDTVWRVRGEEVSPLPWSHYVRLLGVESDAARAFYEREALAGGWTIRQLRRQVGSQFYERTALS